MDFEKDYSYLDRNVGEIKSRIAKANSTGADVVLMAAVKSADVGEINYIHKTLGINDIGENRVQQLLERWEALDKENLRVHFIGSLQTNKVKYIIDKVHLIHSLDSHKLALEIDKQAKKHGIVANVLVEINSGGEENKGGVAPSEVDEFCAEMAQYENIRVCGFMTMAPRCEDRSDYFKYFNATKEIAERAWREVLSRDGEPIISMGMSESFEEAIECGANMVRVGRSMFAK
jgi:pyridoxal phosphate enzyme (YggS family)